MLIEFTKMHGLGNDFVVIDLVTQRLLLNPSQIRRIADRHFGIGCDQLLLIEPPMNPEADFYYRIFNANGYEVAQCGNGARCLARFIHENALTSKNEIIVETQNSKIKLSLNENPELITVDMGAPVLNPEKIPFASSKQNKIYSIQVDGESIEVSVLSMGNPHAIIRAEDLEDLPVDAIGAALNQHDNFPEGVNVSFIKVLKDNHIALRVYERGVGETLACGTAACAAVVAGKLLSLLSDKVTVTLRGGNLEIEWDGNIESPVYLSGPATNIYHGIFKV